MDSDGPWQLVKCKNTRRLISPARWTNITRLSLIVDMENRELVHYTPMGDDDSQPVLHTDSHPDGVVKIYDTVSGEIVFEGTDDELSGFRLFGVKLFGFRMCAFGKGDEVGK